MDRSVTTKTQKTVPFDDANKLDLRNEIQDRYGSHPVPWFRWVFDTLADLPGRSRVLELGAGTGALWRENQERIPDGWKVCISDPEEGMVSSARARQNAGKPRRLRFLLSESQALPFPTASFDAVIAVGVLDVVTDLPAALREVRRALKPGGLFLATAGGEGHLQELEALLRPFLPEEQAEKLGGEEERFGLENGARYLETHFAAVTRQRYNDQLVFRTTQPVLDYIFSEQSLVKDLSLLDVAKIVGMLKGDLERKGSISITLRKGLFLARRPA